MNKWRIRTREGVNTEEEGSFISCDKSGWLFVWKDEYRQELSVAFYKPILVRRIGDDRDR